MRLASSRAVCSEMQRRLDLSVLTRHRARAAAYLRSPLKADENAGPKAAPQSGLVRPRFAQ